MLFREVSTTVSVRGFGNSTYLSTKEGLLWWRLWLSVKGGVLYPQGWAMQSRNVVDSMLSPSPRRHCLLSSLALDPGSSSIPSYCSRLSTSAWAALTYMFTVGFSLRSGASDLKEPLADDWLWWRCSLEVAMHIRIPYSWHHHRGSPRKTQGGLSGQHNFWKTI
jgi:hypothetical protein